MNKKPKTSIRRRQFLRGAGISLALPLLPSALTRTAAKAQDAAPKRYFQIYYPNGNPQPRGDKAPTASLIERLSEFRDQMTVVYNMDNQRIRHQSYPYFKHHHHNCFAPLYSGGAHEGVGGEKKTVDQYIADVIGASSSFPTIAVQLFPKTNAHQGVPPSFFNSTGWKGPRQPVVPYSEPRSLFDALFADGVPSAEPTPDSPTVESPEVLRRKERRGLLLDAVLSDIRDMRAKVNTHDKLRFDEYLTGIEELDRRTRMLEDNAMEEMQDDPSSYMCDQGQPTGLTANDGNYPLYLEVMQDLSLRALQCDLTRVVNFSHASFGGGRVMNNNWVSGMEGVARGWHPLSHWSSPYANLSTNIGLNQRDFERLVGWHYDRVAEMLRKMKNTTTATGGSLLDETLVTWGTSMSHGASHVSDNLFHILIGGGSRFSHGSNIDAGGRPSADMFTAVMNTFGASGKLGQATGPLSSILAA